MKKARKKWSMRTLMNIAILTRARHEDDSHFSYDLIVELTFEICRPSTLSLSFSLSLSNSISIGHLATSIECCS